METSISTPSAPAALGPYSQAMASKGLVFCSGQLPLDPTTGSMIAGDVADQTRQVIANLGAVLAAAGSSLARVLRTTVYLVDLGDLASMNAAYAGAFGSHRPARMTVQVSALPRDARVAVDCIAGRG
jgi:2-iminobutanoate/2-iminopropanoate deaminase